MQTFRQPKYLIILTILVTLFGVLLFFTSFTILTVRTASGEVNVIISKGDDFQEFKLDNSSKSLFLRRGEYKIDVQKDEELTLYSKSLGFFRDNLEVTTASQKKATYIGKDSLLCAAKTDQTPEAYYPCRVGTSSLKTAAEKTAVAKDAGDQGPLKQTVPYGSEFLEAQNEADTLIIRKINALGQETGTAKKFNGSTTEVSDYTLSVEPQGKSFAVYNKSAKTISRYKNFEDPNPISIKMPEDIETEFLNLRIINSLDYVYIFNYSYTLDRHEEGDTPITNKKDSQLPSKIFVYNSSGKQINKYSLPKEWQLRTISAGTKNQIVFYLAGNLFSQAYLIVDDDKPKPLPIPEISPQQVCWSKGSSFYYLANSGSNLFLYDIPESKAQLVYGGLSEGSNIVNLNCLNGRPQIALVSENDGNINEYSHFLISEESHSGVRPESLLPLYFDWQQNAYKIALTQSGLSVLPIYIENSSANIDRNAVLEQAIKEVTPKGINTKSNPLNIGF